MIRKKLIYEEFENIEESKDIDDIENESGTTSTPRKEVVEKIDISNEKNFYNLISQNNGYLKELYNIECENIKLLTGFEIAKIIFDESIRMIII